MNIAQPVVTEIDSVTFKPLDPKTIRAISVKQITHPILFDSLNRPTPGGLYDSALGPVGKNDICSTCHLGQMHCPGHFGHIQLPTSVYNPIFFREMYALLKATCLYCHHFKSGKVQIIRIIAKLRLIEAGLIAAAESIDESVIAPTLEAEKETKKKRKRATDNTNESSSDENDEGDEGDMTEVPPDKITERINAYVEKHLSTSKIMKSKETIGSRVARRQTVAEFFRSISARRNCASCRAPSSTFRNDGCVKIFETGLSDVQLESLVARGMERANVISQRQAKDLCDDLSINKSIQPNSQATDVLSTIMQQPNESSDSDNRMDEDSNSDDEDDATLALSTLTKSDPTLPTMIIAPGDKKSSRKNPNRYITASEVRSHFEILYEEEQDVLCHVFASGSKREKVTPDIFFLDVISVPPTKFRPAAMLGDQVMENFQNEHLVKVLNTSTRIRDLNEELLSASQDKASEEDRRKIFDSLVNSFVQLQNDVNSFLDSSKTQSMSSQRNQLPQGIRQLLEKKEGLFRKHMMGKRVNYAARSVISPDPNLDTNEIGVPPVFATRLTYPEPVTPHNFQELRRAVINGPNAWPGAVYVQNEDGRLLSLASMSEESRKGIANQLLTPQGSRYGIGVGQFTPPLTAVNKKVYRHLKNGDMVIMNRQPTLHKNSMIVFRTRVLPGEKTIRMHYANCNGFNADFDGDEMNMHFPQNDAARAEAMLLADADDQYLVPTSGAPLRGLIQDHVVSGVHMTNKDTFFTREEYQQLLYGSLRPEDDDFGDGWLKTVPPAIVKPKSMWTGKQIITTILQNLTPPNAKGLNMNSKAKIPGRYWGPSPEEGEVIVFDGELLCGILDKSQFGASAFGLVHSVHEVYGSSIAGKLLTILGRLFTKYLQLRGFSCRMDDLMLNTEGDEWRRDLLGKGASYGLEASIEYTGLKDVKLSDMRTRELRSRLEDVLRDEEKLVGLDAMMKGKMNSLTSAIINKCIPDGLHRRFPYNNMQTMTVSGAKGSNVNVSQISCLLGQQELEGRRVPVMVSGKTLPSFKAFDPSARAGGYISGRFLTGVRPQEYYFHCMAGREGLIDTAVKTSRSGYLQRCLIKHLEGIKVHYDHTVRDADGSIYQFHYGEDSLDVTKQKHLNQFKFSVQNYNSLLSKYQPQVVFGNENVDTKEAVSYMKKTRKKPEKYAPALSKYSPSRHFGVTSEKFDNAMEKYIEENPDKLLQGKEEDPRLSSRISYPKKSEFRALMRLRYLHSLVAPGESVGLLASQSVGEPSTQMTLNTFHFAGFGAANVTLGIPRLREIVMTASAHIKTPAMTLQVNDHVSDQIANEFCKSSSRLTLSQILDYVEVLEKFVRNLDEETIVKIYTIRLNFFNKKEYQEEYNVTANEVALAIEREFIDKLQKEVIHALRGRRKRTKGEDTDIPEIGKASKAKKENRPMSSALDDEDDGAAVTGNASDEDDDDATHAKRKQKSSEPWTYDDPDEEDEEIMREDDPEMMDVDPLHDTDEQNEGKLTRDSDGEDGEHITGSQKFKYSKNTNRARLHRIQEVHPSITRFDFDEKDGLSCEIDFQQDSLDKKLLMVAIVELVSRSTVIHEVPGIKRCFSVKSEAANCQTRSLTTEGVNIRAMWNHVITHPVNDKGDMVIDLNKLYSNDIAAILRTYGVEAARSTIVKEIAGVFGVYGIDVDPRHLSLIADYMTFEGTYRAFSRRGIDSNPSPLAKMSFETTCHFLKEAALHQESDDLSNPSARIVLGRPFSGGTGSFDIVAPVSISNINLAS